MPVLSTESTESRVGSMVAGSTSRAARALIPGRESETAEVSALPVKASAEMMIVDFMVVVVVVLTQIWGSSQVSSRCWSVCVMSVGKAEAGTSVVLSNGRADRE
jgi:hypothetical protein